LLHKTLPRVLERRLVKERAQKPTLDAYMSRFGAGPVSFDSAKSYLTGAGACNRGKELLLQLRTGSLPLASHTGKFGRSRRDDPSDTSHYCCPSVRLELNQCLIFCWIALYMRHCVDNCGGGWRRRWRLNAGSCWSRCRLRRRLTSCLIVILWEVSRLLILLPLTSMHAGSFVGRLGMRRSALMSAGPMAVMLWHE
jgi:hypothetical protein